MKKFGIPVTWEVLDTVWVKAESIEEALQWVKDNIDTIPLGTEPEFVEGTYRIVDGSDDGIDINDLSDTIAYLKNYWDLYGDITGHNLE